MDLNELVAFVTVIDAGSFSGAAKRLGVSKSTISERVSSLERALGTTLMHRSTRKFRLTSRGDELYRRGHDIMRAAEDAEQAMSVDVERVVGRVRLSAPVSLGVSHLGPVISKLSRDFPHLDVDVDLLDAEVDLLEQPYDLALRVGTLAQPGLIARRIGEFRRIVVAAPGYVKEHGAPKCPGDLSEHRCLRFAHQKNPDVWTFEHEGESERVRVDGPITSNNGDFLAVLVEQGAGLAWLPDFIVRASLDQGRLVRVLDDACRDYVPLHLVFPTRRYVPARVRAVADALKDAFAKQASNDREYPRT